MTLENELKALTERIHLLETTVFRSRQVPSAAQPRTRHTLLPQLFGDVVEVFPDDITLSALFTSRLRDLAGWEKRWEQNQQTGNVKRQRVGRLKIIGPAIANCYHR